MGAAVFLPASFFSAGAFPAGALPPVVGFFSAAFGGISGRFRLILMMEGGVGDEMC